MPILSYFVKKARVYFTPENVYKLINFIYQLIKEFIFIHLRYLIQFLNAHWALFLIIIISLQPKPLKFLIRANYYLLSLFIINYSLNRFLALIFI